jgi:hypothetical protein
MSGAFMLHGAHGPGAALGRIVSSLYYANQKKLLVGMVFVFA